MRKYLLKGIAVLAMGCVMTACSQDFSYEQQEQQASLNNAQQTLGFYIPENQDWVMSTTISTNIPINFEDGETYTVKVYSNDPLMDGIGQVLAKETVSNGQTFSVSFLAPTYKGAYSIGITNSKGETMYRTAYLEDGQLTEFVEDIPVETESKSRTRSITVNGDTYSEFNFPSNDELTAAFPTAVPSNADELQAYGDYHYYLNNGAGHNYKITNSGTYSIGGTWWNYVWNGSANVLSPYNVYVDVDGDVTIYRNGAAAFNLYILNGNVTLDSNFGECGGLISVAAGATLNDGRDHIAFNDGIKLYNRGTVNATNSWKYDIGNNAALYNEGSFNVTGALSYSAGSNNTSFFINMGDDAVLTAPSMTMNSTCHFYSDGNVNITGETRVTQSRITWINNGHYTTGSMVFSANNSTFYNYCQLIIKGDGCFKDGSLNMMDNSYAEVNKGVFNNFHVDMGNNSGFNVKNGTKWGLQGTGTPQGFFAKNDNARAYVRLGGDNQVPAHVGGALQLSGANLVFAYNSIKFYEGAYIGETYDGSNTWNETTAEKLRKDQDGRITWNTNNVTKFVTGDDFANVKVETKNGQCAATWTIPGEPTIVEENQTWTYAFEDNKTRCDFDLNDVVIQVRESETDASQLIVTLVAAGCEYDNYVWLGEELIAWPNGAEVHDAFGANHGVMVNTGNGKGVDMSPVSVSINKPNDFDFQSADFKIRPYKINSDRTEDNARGSYITIQKAGVETGLWGPLGLAIPGKWKWPNERIIVNYAYPDFTAWGKNSDLTLRPELSGWYQNPTSGLVYGE